MGSDTGLDAILRELGAFGKYNVMNYALLLFPIYLAGTYVSVFVFEAPDINYRCNTKTLRNINNNVWTLFHRCYVPECEQLNNTLWLNYTIPKENGVFMKCKRYALNTNSSYCGFDNFNTSKIRDCDTIIYGDEDSAVKDFDLGCQNWKRTLIGSIHNFGMLSLPLSGAISDKYGRKLVLCIASLMRGTFGLLRSFAPNYPTMIALEFFEGVTGAGMYNTAFVIAIELVTPKGRVFGSTAINILFVLGLMTLSGLSWWLQNWRTLLRVIYIPALFILSYYWILNESIRWLMTKGRYQEATMILKKAARMNKVQLSDEVFAPLNELKKLPIEDTNTENRTDSNEAEKNTESLNIIKVLKSSIIRKRLLACSFLWITCSFVYYGLSINSVSLAGNMYVNFMLVAFVEIPANFACLLLLDRFGRKRVLVNTYVLSACLCIILSFLPKTHKWWSLTLYLSGKFTISVAYSTIYIYVSEMFPTSARQSLLATCATVGRMGAVAAPLTPLLALYYHNLPAIFFGSITLVASLLVFTLPETTNKALPDTIEEAEALSRKDGERNLL